MEKSVESIFARSWELLTKNWILLVPGIVVGIAVGFVTGLLTPNGDTDTGYPFSGLATASSNVIVKIIGIAGYIVTQCYIAGMAGAAWQRGRTTLEDGALALRVDAGNVFVAAIGLFVVGIIAALLALPTLGLSFLAYYVLFIYTIASAVVGNHRGRDALAESFRIAKTRFAPTIIIALVLVVIRILVGFLANLLGFMPLIGPIVGAVINQIVVVFATLVVVGEYLNLRGAPASGPTIDEI